MLKQLIALGLAVVQGQPQKTAENHSAVTFFHVIETIARADASTAWCLSQAGGCAMAAAYLDLPVAQAIFGNDPRAVLAGHDSHTLFSTIGDTIRTGPTLTNVNDVRAILIA